MSGRVPKSDYAKVADVGSRFAGRAMRPVGDVQVPTFPKVAFVLGPLDALEYSTRRTNAKGKTVTEYYRHEFAEADRPTLVVGKNKKVFLLGGRYRFTELGIVDASDKQHAGAK